jgi:hypothetical protein
MADLNALIAQGVQFKAPPDPFAQYAQMQQMQQGQQANQLNQMKMQEYQRGLQEQEGVRNFLKATPNFDPTNPTHQTGLMQVAPTTAPKLLESFLTTRKTVADIGKTTEETKGKTFENRLAQANKAITDIATLGSAEEAIAGIDRHLANGDIDQYKANALKTQLAQAPSFQKWRTDMVVGILSAKDKLERTAPKPTQINLNNVVKTIDMNPDSPTFKQEVIPAQTVGMTPFQEADIGVKQGQLKVSQSRLNAEMATGNLTPETRDFLAQTYIQTGTLPPMGMGKAAARMRQDVLDRAASIATTGGVSAADAAGAVKTNKAELAGATAGQRAIGTQAANISMASTELEKMIPIAESYVTKVNPTDYPIINKVGNFIAKSTGDANQVGLATALNSLVNVYARAISPKGIPTVSDKMHAREIVQQAMSAGQLGEAFKVMRQESAAAKASGPEVRAGMRGSPAPAAGVWGKAVPE